MEIESTRNSRRPVDLPRDKPQVDRVEHANFERRPGALLHPQARRLRSPRRAWGLGVPRWR